MRAYGDVMEKPALPLTDLTLNKRSDTSLHSSLELNSDDMEVTQLSSQYVAPTPSAPPRPTLNKDKSAYH